MEKHKEIDYEKSTLNKADRHEMLFILRGQDESAPKTIMLWIAENMQCSDEKLREAFECALQMRRHHGLKSAD